MSAEAPELFRLPLRMAYALYAWLLLLALGLLALFCVLLLPKLAWRRRLARTAAGAYLRLIGMSLEIRDAGHVPEGQCVIVSNHASYLDGLVFMALLPPRFGFVIKREMARVPLAGALLHRIGSEFVERFDRHKSGADARRVLRKAASGSSLVFFPEGTFEPEPGLLKFHTGAFAVAARAGCPVVPAVIRGTREALPSRTILPRPHRITVRLLPALPAVPGSPDHAAAELRDRAREVILAELGEPDLTRSGDTARPPDTELARSGQASSS